ncbi:unnamed protein product [Rotaria magnacalcarata]|uniref:Uncharacterized protein n=2 Tax=Rotaria magnacalcarata TaxID=392030 RepID=A0A816Q3W2_9BILA|nr:unnamed protein product [Rotaria magnacalcarata]CAF5172886.1 unnamed protein product [Rotaria magnacalcarata]
MNKEEFWCDVDNLKRMQQEHISKLDTNLLASSLDEEHVAWLKQKKTQKLFRRTMIMYACLIRTYLFVLWLNTYISSFIPVSATCYDDSTKYHSERVETLLKLCDEIRPNLMLATGGTRISLHDITPEATS